jgi:large subunit ribosomal protein L15
MNLSNLKPAKGANRTKRRLGRGEGSGYGDTAGRGHKGAKSRSGYSKKRGFEGGQMPIQRRLPKFGFKNPNRVSFRGINLDVLEKVATDKKIDTFSPEVFVENGLASKNDRIKILGRGELKSKINVTAHAFSVSAKEAIEGKGGEAKTL